MQEIMISKRSKILFFLTGFFVFSSVYKLVLSNLLGINLNLPEILLIPLAFSLRKVVKFRFSTTSLFFSLVLWAILYFLGKQQPSSGSLFTHSRGFLYIFLFYHFFKNSHTDFKTDFVFYLTLGSLVGWLIVSIYNLFLTRYSILDISGFTYGNLLSIPLFLSTAFLKDKKLWFNIGIGIIIAIIFTAGLRRVIVVFLVSLILLYFYPNVHTKFNKLLVSWGVLAIFGIVIYLNIDKIGDYIYQYSPTTYYRIFEKTIESIDEDMIAEDIQRIGFIEYYLQHYDDALFPNGFLKTSSEQEFGRYNDFPILELSHTFGFIGLLLITVYFVRCLLLSMKKAYYQQNVLIYLIPGILVFVLAFLDGSFLTSPIVTPLTGLCLGKMSLSSKKNIINES